jgi:hypothetical protein
MRAEELQRWMPARQTNADEGEAEQQRDPAAYRAGSKPCDEGAI